MKSPVSRLRRERSRCHHRRGAEVPQAHCSRSEKSPPECLASSEQHLLALTRLFQDTKIVHTLVRPTPRVWEHHMVTEIQEWTSTEIEKVQRRATKFIPSLRNLLLRRPTAEN